MSFKVIDQAPARLNRSELAVPGSNPRFIEKAAVSSADVIFLDLEDAVAPDDKAQARKNIIEALNDVDWGTKTVAVRINGLDTHYCYRDVVDVVEQAGNNLDLIMIPKVGTAADVYAIDMMVTQICEAKGFKNKIGFEMIIETALGLQNMAEIAAASSRNESLHFGVADYAASTKARTTGIGGPNPDYHVLTDADAEGNRDIHWGDVWHYPIHKMVVCARANGLRPIDGPFGDIRDPDGYAAQAKRAAVLGCEGKWAIHPSQIDIANEVYSPSKQEVAKARAILKAMKEAQKEGLGAVTLDGRLIDIASIRQAEVMVSKAREVARAEKIAAGPAKKPTAGKKKK
ncbi:MAG: CoA ester lyase [Rhodospirillaceae bacterium]|jgi:malyl-CoA/(S)-citramalyl-CoA lyase|nr:CoA ester lyase [Rhodospirillaceae bacterium]